MAGGGDRDESATRKGPAELRSFGRRKGRRLSAHQQHLIESLMPRHRIAVDAPASETEWLPADAHRLWLEIGFGGGEHLAWQARANPGVDFIGCEPFQDGVIKVLAAIETEGLGNIRIHDGDARDLLRWLPPGSVGRVFILFPDPWPKRRHAKRRLVNAHTLDLLARVMVSGAELRFASDIADYVRTALFALTSHPAFRWDARSPADWRTRPGDWPETRYERKAIREGRRCYYFSFRRI
ncbi:MAG: tRNA (guanine(46)-N(7))-methyltransferase TrmB [Hyphomicrobiaceae bacterium]